MEMSGIIASGFSVVSRFIIFISAFRIILCGFVLCVCVGAAVRQEGVSDLGCGETCGDRHYARLITVA